MKANTISGQRQYAFVSQFNYIREAGTEGEEKAACRIEKELSEIAEKWGQGELQIRREPFEIETWQSYPRSHHGTYPGIGPTDRHAIRRFFLFSPHFDDRSLRRRRRSRLGPAKEGFINGSGCGDRHSGTFIITHRQ